MHYTAGWTTQGDINTLVHSSNPVSVHLILGRDGQLFQSVPFNKRAWHAGPSRYKPLGLSDINTHSIGIEICNHGYVEDMGNGLYKSWNGLSYSTPPGADCVPFSEWEKAPSPILAKRASDRAVWEPYYAPQLDVLDDVVRALHKKYKIQAIVSHEEIDTRGWKSDPGPAFPMRRYQKLLEDRGAAGDTEELDETSPDVYLTPWGAVRREEMTLMRVTAPVTARQHALWLTEGNTVATLSKGSVVAVDTSRQYNSMYPGVIQHLNKQVPAWVPIEYLRKV